MDSTELHATNTEYVTLEKVESLLQPLLAEIKSLRAQLNAAKAPLNQPSSSETLSGLGQLQIDPDDRSSDFGTLEQKDVPTDMDLLSPTQSYSEPTHLEDSGLTYDDAFRKDGGDEAVDRFASIRQQVYDLAVDPKLAVELRELFPGDRRGYSTVLVNQPFSSSFQEVYQYACRVLPEFQKAVSAAATASGGHPILPPLKSAQRAFAKSAFKYRDGNGVAWYRLTDLVRGTIAYDDIESMYKGLPIVVAEFKLREFNDRYHSPMPGGYRDLQLVVDIGGHLCELQLNTKAMLEAKAATGHRDYELVRELEAAITAGDLGACKQAFEWSRQHLGSARQLTVLNKDNASHLLPRACASGHVDIALCLLAQKCDPDAKDKDGNTGLHLAMRGGHERTVWALLNRGKADFTIKNASGQTALLLGYLSFRKDADERRARALCTLACSSGLAHVIETRYQIDREIKECRYNSSHLVDFAREGRADKVAEELKNFANPDSEREGETALMAAVKKNWLKCIELLLQERPSPKVRQDACLVALNEGKWKIAEQILLSDDCITSEKVAEFTCHVPAAVASGRELCVQLLLRQILRFPSQIPAPIKETDLHFMEKAISAGPIDPTMLELLLRVSCESRIRLQSIKLEQRSLEKEHIRVLIEFIPKLSQLHELRFEIDRYAPHLDGVWGELGSALAKTTNENLSCHVGEFCLKLKSLQTQEPIFFGKSQESLASTNVYLLLLSGVILSLRLKVSIETYNQTRVCTDPSPEALLALNSGQWIIIFQNSSFFKMFLARTTHWTYGTKELHGGNWSVRGALKRTCIKTPPLILASMLFLALSTSLCYYLVVLLFRWMFSRL